jgi:hypothetical protein
MKIKVAMLVGIVFILAACNKEDGPCPQSKVIDQGDAIMFEVNRFKDASDVNVGMTAKDVQNVIIRQELYKSKVEEMEVIDCMEGFKWKVITSMEYAIDASNAILSKKGDDVTTPLFEKAIEYTEQAASEMERLKKCIPDCE